MSDYPDLVTSLTPREVCERLHDLAVKVPRTQAVVEIGVYRARTTCWLAAGTQAGKGAHVYGVDPWDLSDRTPRRSKFTRSATYEFAQRYVADAGYGDQVTLIRGYSADVAAEWDGPRVGLLYVDGDHSPQGVRADWDAWSPHLVATAAVVWDDYAEPARPGVAEVVDRLHTEGRITAPQGIGGTAVLTRPRRRATST